MFKPKNEKIAELAKKYPYRIQELEKIFDKKTNIYIDFANVFQWQEKLGWHISLKRLKQLMGSFTTINQIKFYSGTLIGDMKSERIIAEAKALEYEVVTKPVKIMRLSIDISSIAPESPEILKQFIRDSLLKKLNIETIKFLNNRLRELNQQGVMFIEDLKCNFDVEIGRDMLLDYHKDMVQNFILWSGDSDFADPLRQLLLDGKKVGIFATVRRIATELNELKKSGLFIFEIQKIRDFICWPRDNRQE